MLLALMLLRRDLERICPGAAFDNLELWCLIVATYGSAPGIVSSVKPAREFGALAIEVGDGGRMAEAELEALRWCLGDVCLGAFESQLHP
jgi:hypothetical protein